MEAIPGGQGHPHPLNPKHHQLRGLSRREGLAESDPRGAHRHEGAEVSRSAWMWERRVPGRRAQPAPGPQGAEQGVAGRGLVLREGSLGAATGKVNESRAGTYPGL